MGLGRPVEEIVDHLDVPPEDPDTGGEYHARPGSSVATRHHLLSPGGAQLIQFIHKKHGATPIRLWRHKVLVQTGASIQCCHFPTLGKIQEKTKPTIDP